MKDGWHLPQNIRDSITAEISSDLRSYIKRRQKQRETETPLDGCRLEDVTDKYNNNLNTNMNVTATPEVLNENAVPPPEREKTTEDSDQTKDESDSKPQKPRKPFRFPNGQDEWIIDVDHGCGDGRYYQYQSERKRGGGTFLCVCRYKACLG